MKPHRLLHSWPVAKGLLRTAMLLVPWGSRRDWLAEWTGELWQVGAAYGAGRSGHFHGDARITAFCMGAFQDAFALGPGRWKHCVAGRLEPGSPWRCLLPLAILLAVSAAMSAGVPQVHRAAWASARTADDDLVLISREGSLQDAVPTIRLEEYRDWKAGPAPFLKRLIFYSVATARVKQTGVFAGAHPAQMRVAYASESMLDVLAPSLSRVAHGGGANGPRVLISRAVWRQSFGGDPFVAGRRVRIAGRTVTVFGVAPKALWPLPGNMDAVVLESDDDLAALQPPALGFVLAPGIAPTLIQDVFGHPYLMAKQASGSVVRFECGTLAQRRIRPLTLFLFTLLLAAIALPATTPLPLGEYSAAIQSQRPVNRVRRGVFFVGKVGLSVPAVYFASVALVYAGLPLGSQPAEYTQMALSFCGLLFAFRWAIRDQRKRCPTCLRLLTQPAHVGHPSHIFLAWHGTEMVCAGGHGLLYIPEHPTSWCSTQRWQTLDRSWAELFVA